jgi:hypothetical protein
MRENLRESKGLCKTRLEALADVAINSIRGLGRSILKMRWTDTYLQPYDKFSHVYDDIGCRSGTEGYDMS